MKRVLLIMLFVNLSTALFARSEVDTASNVVSYYDELNLKFVLNTKYNNFVVSNDFLPSDINWRTNDDNTIGFGFNYKWLGLNLLFNIKALNNDDSIYGQTESFNILSNIYTKSIGIDAYVQSTRGFYLENPSDWYPAWTSDLPYPTNSHLQVVNLGVNFLYVQESEKFSLRANFILNERQLKSAGSPILGAYANVFYLRSDTSFLTFVPDTIPEYKIDVKEAGYSNFGVFGGYSHTFIIEDYFFISLTGALGLAIQSSDIITRIEDYNDLDAQRINGKFHARFALGYANDKNFISLSLIADNNRLGQSLNYNFGYARLTYGHRFSLKKRKPDQ